MPLKFEESAGGIVFEKKDGQVLVIVTQHSQHHGWVFPKGLIDKGENKKSTALREVEEEAGVQAKIIQELPPTEYFYQLQEQKIKKILRVKLIFILKNVQEEAIPRNIIILVKEQNLKHHKRLQ